MDERINNTEHSCSQLGIVLRIFGSTYLFEVITNDLHVNKGRSRWGEKHIMRSLESYIQPLSMRSSGSLRQDL
jgi:hypothetical protein